MLVTYRRRLLARGLGSRSVCLWTLLPEWARFPRARTAALAAGAVAEQLRQTERPGLACNHEGTRTGPDLNKRFSRTE